ncbi:hypothetical protein Tco_1444537, partial [Tanacetum coccineum]
KRDRGEAAVKTPEPPSEDSLIFLGFQASDGLRQWMHRLLYINCQAVDGLCGNISLLGRIERVIWDGGEEPRN